MGPRGGFTRGSADSALRSQLTRRSWPCSPAQVRGMLSRRSKQPRLAPYQSIHQGRAPVFRTCATPKHELQRRPYRGNRPIAPYLQARNTSPPDNLSTPLTSAPNTRRVRVNTASPQKSRGNPFYSNPSQPPRSQKTEKVSLSLFL